MYKISVDKFQGPLDLLLQLIEQEKLEITEISLSQVTDSYLEYLETLTDYDPEELSDFLVIAARLLLLKSRAILPEVEDEEPVDDLEKQLKIYKEFLEATKKVEALLKLERFSFSRLKPAYELKVEFSPANNITTDNLKLSMLAVLKRLDPLVRLPKQFIERAVSLQQKIMHLKELLLGKNKMTFKDIFESAQSKTEVIVSFLALLELVKQRHLTLNQSSLFEDIIIEKS